MHYTSAILIHYETSVIPIHYEPPAIFISYSSHWTHLSFSILHFILTCYIMFSIILSHWSSITTAISIYLILLCKSDKLLSIIVKISAKAESTVRVRPYHKKVIMNVYPVVIGHCMEHTFGAPHVYHKAFSKLYWSLECCTFEEQSHKALWNHARLYSNCAHQRLELQEYCSS